VIYAIVMKMEKTVTGWKRKNKKGRGGGGGEYLLSGFWEGAEDRGRNSFGKGLDERRLRAIPPASGHFSAANFLEGKYNGEELVSKKIKNLSRSR